MKRDLTTSRLAVTLAIFAAFALSAMAWDVTPGDSREDVVKALGNPEGHIRSGTYEICFFDRGQVRLRDGKVTDVWLVSEEVAAARNAERELERQARIRDVREQKARLRAEGEAIRAVKLADPAFANLPAGEQYAFWEQFRQAYPGVDVDTVYATTRDRYEQEQETARLRARVAELQQRAAEAEARARRAVSEAENARSRWPSVTYALPPLTTPYAPVYTVRRPVCVTVPRHVIPSPSSVCNPPRVRSFPPPSSRTTVGQWRAPTVCSPSTRLPTLPSSRSSGFHMCMQF